MAASANSVHWRGVNHLALVTTDMDATVRFWHGVLGARLVATIGTPAFKHYFFDIGDGNTIAFFEYADQQLDTYAKPAGVPYGKASFADAEPVSAVAELRAGGTLDHTVSTKLVDAIIEDIYRTGV